MEEQRLKPSKSYQIAFTVCMDKINKLISSNTVARFKIGKSGDDPTARKTEYLERNAYHEFHIVFTILDRSLINELEKALIKHYMIKESKRCANELIGGGKITGEQKPYIYLVIKYSFLKALREQLR
jgi:hypothetical protein